MTETTLCPCGSKKEFAQCCQLAISGSEPAPTAEALMRSRYCAYVNEEWRYLFNTWQPQTRPTRKSLSRSDSVNWISLEILGSTGGQALDDKGTVEFRAIWQNHDGSESSLHENSRFERLNGRWVYVDGEIYSD